MEEVVGSGLSESSTVEQETHHHHNHDDHDQSDDQMVGIAYDYEGCDESSELELGLGLSLGVLGSSQKHTNFSNNDKNKKQIPRILTAKDLGSRNNNVVVVSPPSASSCSSLGLRTPSKTCSNSAVSNVVNINKNNNIVSSGTKRAASPTAVCQVVGWPPIRAYRMNSMANQAKSIATGEHNSQFEESEAKDGIYGANDKGNANSKDRVPHKCSLFVKVNMDGVAIGRKVDLTAHSSYISLARALEEMFTNRAAEKSNAEELILMPKVTRPSKLLDGTSDFVLTYEDKDGDWMLVGDVPWGMFVTSVKRLKIMRASDANGLAPRSEDRSSKQRSRPI